MSKGFYSLYKRQIERRAYSEEYITEVVEHAYNHGALTKKEYDNLVALINNVYSE